jgi:UDP:flavonoid glycosyltransferase YjiC (YdhE family)
VNVLLCPLSDGGYLYPAIAAGRELRCRGHIVSALGRARDAPVLAEADLPFTPIEDFGERTGFSAACWYSTGMEQYQVTLRAAAQARADVLVTSVLCHGALIAAEVLDIPAVVIGLSVHLWDYQAGGDGEPQGKTRENRTRDTIGHHAALREQAGLRPRRYPQAQSPLLGAALLLRGAPVLEYPGAVLPAGVHHVGPLAWEPAADPGEIDELRAHLDRIGKPVVYVHLGRFFEGINQWPALNAAFTAGPFQAIVERGRSRDPRPAPGADILLVHKPWMGPLIDRAGLVLTSGTSAPVLASLLRGRPLGVSPNGAEQPLLAAACLRAGVAVRVPRTVTRDPAALLRSAWRDPGLRGRARDLGRELAAADSAVRAADLIEQVASSAGAARVLDASPALGKAGKG